MIDNTSITITIIIGFALFSVSSYWLANKITENDETQTKILKCLIVLLIGIFLIAFGAARNAIHHTLGAPIKFSEIKEQKYILKEVPQNWRLVQKYCEKPSGNEWRL